jgi:sporulation protein YlmC with PRC-barrel domain
MDIPINAEVYCTDGHCGRSTHVILKRPSEEVTHVVVRQNQAPHTEVLVPITAVTATTPDSINLRYTRHELGRLDPFIETEYVKVNIPRYEDAGMYYMWPGEYTEPKIVSVSHEAIPAGELAVRQGARVEATDGHVGQVNDFLVDPVSARITHLVLREGHLWGQKDVTIPVSEIERIEEDTIYLKLDKCGIEALPAIPIQR